MNKIHILIAIKYFAIFQLFLNIWSAYSSVCIFDKTHNTYDTIPSETHTGLACIPLIQFCEALNFEWKWDPFSERFEIEYMESIVSLVQNNSFYTVNKSTFQLIYPPFRIRESLFLPIIEAAEVFSHLDNCTVTWLEKDNLVTFSENDVDNIEIPDKTVEKKLIAGDKNEKVISGTYVSDSGKQQNTVPEDLKNNYAYKIKTIVIDPGHGGMDPGAVGADKVAEKNVVLAIGLALRNELKKDTTLKVYMTRSTDIFIPLGERTKIANEKKADLFISIHTNSIGGPLSRKSDINGYKIYFLSQAKNEEDKLVAMRENSVIELEKEVPKKDLLQNILIEMANNEFLTESQELSILIAESFKASLKKVKPLHKGVGQANFWVLNGAYMPSVLIETCFISNPAEEKLLNSKKYQKKIALAIKDAILKFKEKYEAGL
ncbi:MAG: N-acetylmuramoyl-L-alanine amidase [Chitinispirillia bacterium]|jgi:N-acetylmuramoyl-L-alanine amidase